MRIRRVTAQNAGPFRDPVDIKFRGDDSVVGIVGRYADNPRRSNESGKSSFMDLVAYAFFGKKAVSDNDLIHDWATDDMIVGVEAEGIDGESLVIRRGRKLSGGAIFEVEGCEGTRQAELQEFVDKRIGISYDDYVALSYFDRTNIHRFLGGKQSDYLERWLPLKRWTDFIAACSKKAESVRNRIDVLQTRAEDYRLTTSKIGSFRSKWREARTAVKATRKRVELIQGRVRRLEELSAGERAVRELERRLGSLKRQISSIRASLYHAEQTLADLDTQLMEIQEGTCPLIKKRRCKPLARKAKRKGQLRYANAKDRVDALKVELAAVRLEYAKLKEQIESVDQRVVDPAEVKEAKQELRQIRRSLEGAIATEATTRATLRGAKKVKGKLSEVKAEIDTLVVKRSRWNKLISAANRTRYIQLDNALLGVEDRCNSILDTMDVSGRIRFSTTRELATKWEPFCVECGGEIFNRGICSNCRAKRQKQRRDELSVEIVHADRVRKFARESTGAQLLLSFGVRMACMTMLSESLGVPLDLVLLDEPLGHLDEMNRDSLLSIIVNRLRSEFGVRQCFVISHVNEVRDIADRTLVVTRDKTSSTVGWEK